MKRLFNNMSLAWKLTLVILIAVAIPVTMVSIFLSRQMYRMITSDTLLSEQNALARTAPYLNSVLQEVTGCSYDIQSLPFARTLFRDGLDGTVQEALASEEVSSFAAGCEDRMSGTPVSAVRFYVDLPKDDPVFSRESLFISMETIRPVYWYGIFYGSRPSSLFCAPFYLSGRERREFGDCAYIVPLYIRSTNGMLCRCYMAVYFSADTLADILSECLSGTGGVSYITTERDAMIASTDPALAGLYHMNYDSINENLEAARGFMEKEVLGENVYVNSYSLTSSGWVLVSVTPQAPLIRQSREMWLRILLTWILAATAGVLISVLLARSISRRIGTVSRQMARVKTGMPEPMPPDPSQDEIGRLVESYNYMTNTIHRLEEERQRAFDELRSAEFRSLQAQINPHFLYNTLEMINWNSQQGRTVKTAQAVRALSRFYRLTLSGKDPMTTVGKELEQVSLYVSLQNMRFDDAVNYVVDVPDILTDRHIPRLTLQPIVENAILHGIQEKESRRGTIVITGWEEGNEIVLVVADDGVGMDEETLAHILERKEENEDSSHIAVFNTHRRLQLLYGSGYGLRYRSTKGGGTETEIRIPAMSPATRNAQALG